MACYLGPMSSAANRVARIELYHVAVPLPATFRPAWIPGMPQNENRFTLVRVVTEDGVEGFSAGPAIGRERAGLGDVLGPLVLPGDATRRTVQLAQRLSGPELRVNRITIGDEPTPEFLQVTFVGVDLNWHLPQQHASQR